MKARGLVIVLSFAFSLFVFSGCQRTDNANVAPVASPTPETIDTAAIEAQLIKLERDWANAVKNGDADTVRQVMADEIVVINPDGSTSTKAEEADAVQARLWRGRS